MNKIPNNLIVFFHDKAALPDSFAQAFKTTTSANPEFKPLFLDDESTTKLIADNFPHFSDLYPRIRIPAARADIARLIALYVYGGIYVDIAMAFHTSASKLISPDDELLLVRRDDSPFYKDRKSAAHFVNGIIGAREQAPFILECLKRAYFNLRTGYHNYNVVAATGPHIITETYFQIDRDARSSINIKNFSEMQGAYFKMIRAPGVSNMWVVEQRNGVIPGIENVGSRPQDDFWTKALNALTIAPKSGN